MLRFLCLLLVLLSPPALAQEAPTCHELAKTPMEQVYCDIKQKSPTTRLPSINEFRRNPEKTQWLLLKRPAKKLGLTLPDVKRNKKHQKKQKQPKAAEAKKASVRQQPSGGGLSDYCKLAQKTITCETLVFVLQNNISNSKLAAGALLLGTKVKFPIFTGNKHKNNDVIPYLKESYLIYIQHMLKIGLAASTMSFTKFYHTFMEVESKKVRFSERMAKMFMYLKKDKASIGVKSRFNNLLPTSLENCSALSKKIIICDNVKQTWVFQQK